MLNKEMLLAGGSGMATLTIAFADTFGLAPYSAEIRYPDSGLPTESLSIKGSTGKLFPPLVREVPVGHRVTIMVLSKFVQISLSNNTPGYGFEEEDRDTSAGELFVTIRVLQKEAQATLVIS